MEDEKTPAEILEEAADIKKTPAEILEEAADIMERRGFRRSRLIDTEGHVCALGAISLAMFGEEFGVGMLMERENLIPEDAQAVAPKGWTSPYAEFPVHQTFASHLLDATDAVDQDPRFNLCQERSVNLVHQVNDWTTLDMIHEMRMAAKRWRQDNE